MSKIIVIGNLTKDGEVGLTHNGIEYLRTAIAENLSEDETIFYELTLFRPSEHAKRSFAKGARVHIIGGFEDYMYEHGGERKLSRNITVDSYQLLAKAKSGSDGARNKKVR